MPNYCVNRIAQSGSGDHEVHDLSTTTGCLPSAANQLQLGWHNDCAGAVREAKRYFNDVNGCYYCARQCHTS